MPAPGGRVRLILSDCPCDSGSPPGAPSTDPDPDAATTDGTLSPRPPAGNNTHERVSELARGPECRTRVTCRPEVPALLPRTLRLREAEGLTL